MLSVPESLTSMQQSTSSLLQLRFPVQRLQLQDATSIKATTGRIEGTATAAALSLKEGWGATLLPVCDPHQQCHM